MWRMRTGWKSAASIALLALLAAPLAEAPAASRSPAGSASSLEALDTASLKSIAAWLKTSGKEGYLAADVADAAGIPRTEAEEALDVSQRGFKSGDVLRVAQLSADQNRDFLLFMVQRPQGEVFFYHSSLRDGLKKAFVSLPGTTGVVALDGADAQAGFQQEISYWEARIAGL